MIIQTVKAKSKDNPVSKDKIKRLSSQWRQDKLFRICSLWI